MSTLTAGILHSINILLRSGDEQAAKILHRETGINYACKTDRLAITRQWHAGAINDSTLAFFKFHQKRRTARRLAGK